VVYLTVTNTGGAEDRLERVSTEAGTASMHESSMSGGIMRMRPVTDGLPVRAGSSVEFKPNGLHIMLEKLKAPLAAGSHFSITLHFRKSGDRSAQVDVRDGAAEHGGSHHQ